MFYFKEMQLNYKQFAEKLSKTFSIIMRAFKSFPSTIIQQKYISEAFSSKKNNFNTFHKSFPLQSRFVIVFSSIYAIQHWRN